MAQFDQALDRTGTASFKWDFRKQFFGREDILPLSVADMDFMSPPVVIEALHQRVSHGLFGYTGYTEGFLQSIVDWHGQRHDWEIDPEWILEVPGVIPGMHMAIQALSDEEDRILTFSPVYNPFFDAVKRNDRTLVISKLEFKKGRYKIDWDDLEKKLKTGVRLLLWCNPHNPIGRVWTEEEQSKLAKMCRKFGTRIISDEIHADIIYSGHKHVPMASLGEKVSDMTITLTSPGKSFNLQALHCAALICSKKKLLKKISNVKHQMGLYHGNALSMVAHEAAYRHGGEWLDELLNYLEGNRALLRERIEAIPNIRLVEPEGTYVGWLDFRDMDLRADELHSFCMEKAKLGLIKGETYGAGGEGFMRLNFAVPRHILEQAMDQLEGACQ